MYSMKPDGSNVTFLFDASAMLPENLAWSPDGKRVAYVLTGKLRVLDLDTKAARVLADASTYVPPTWSPDGTKLAFGGPSSARYRLPVGAAPDSPWPQKYAEPWAAVINADGSGLIGQAKDSVIEQTESQVVWTPDGKEIVFMRGIAGTPGVPFRGIYRIQLQGLSMSRLQVGPELFAARLAMSPDGRYVLSYDRFDDWFHVSSLYQGWDVHLGYENCHKDLPTWSPRGFITIALPASGPCGEGNLDIALVTEETSLVTQWLTDTPKDDYSASWSPDSRFIAFVSERDGNGEIYVMNADGTEQTNITHTARDEYLPTWLP